MFPFVCGLALGFLLVGMGSLLMLMWDRYKSTK